MTSIAAARRQAADLADLIEALGADIAARYGQAEVEAITAVAEKLRGKIGSAISPADVIRDTQELTALGQRLAADVLPPDYIPQLVAAAAQNGALAIGPGGRTVADLAVQAALSRVGLRMSQQLAVLQAPLAAWAANVYRRFAAASIANVTAGIDTIQDAQRRLVRNVLAAGIGGFRDAGGRNWRIGSYAEMLVRTGAMDAWDTAHAVALGGADINLVQIVAGAGACPECSAVSGLIWSIDGTPGGTYTLTSATSGRPVQVTVAGGLDEARSRGWRHPNCRCTTVAYLPGTQRLTGTTYDPAAERNRDQLRDLERRKRDAKRLEAAALDDVERQRARARIRELDAAIREHTARTGLNRRRYREQLSFSDGRTR